jgi:hypothetical protein
MITTEEIATAVYRMLQGSPVATMITGEVTYQRSDYSKEDVVIVPHAITGEGSVRYGVIKVRTHVPDIARTTDKNPTYTIHFKRLIEIRAKVIEVLGNHYEVGEGYNWNIGLLNPPIKEPNHDEHFVSLDLELTVRNKV